MDGGRETIGVIGTGYVGLVTAAGFAELGSEVWCIDIDAEKIERLSRGEIPIYEPGLAELVASHRDRLHFSTDIADALEHARLLFVAVGTPPTYSGDADLSRRPRGRRRDAALRPPRARHEVDGPRRHRRLDQARLRRARQGGLPLRLLPRVPQGGLGDRGLPAPGPRRHRRRRRLGRRRRGRALPAAADARARRWRAGELVRTDIASAEMVKLAANAFLATKISFINEIANVCEVTGADVIEVARGIGLDDRIGPKFLQPGIGFGGSCFPKDVSALKQLAGNSRLPLPAAQRGHRGQRAAEAPGHRQARRSTSARSWASASRCSAWPSSRTPTTCARRRSLVLAARLQADGALVARLRPDRRG